MKTLIQTEKKFRDMCNEVLKIDKVTVESMLFQVVHLLPGGQEGRKNIIVRFVQLRYR